MNAGEMVTPLKPKGKTKHDVTEDIKELKVEKWYPKSVDKASI
jgi:hypothetical protein